MTATVAVVVKDRRAPMAACLNGIAALPEQPSVVLVDNGSTDGTYELLRDWAAAIPNAVQVHRDTGSLGRIRNLAVERSTTELVAFTDSDCVPRHDWLAHLSAPFDDEGVGVVQGHTVPQEDVPAWSVSQRITDFSGLYEACNIAYRRAPLLAAGGFGEDIGFFGEDTVAGYRMRRAGWRAAFAPDAVVEHDVTRPGLDWWVRRGLMYSHFPALVREFPEMRELLWHRGFLRRRSAFAALAAGGILGSAAVRSLGPLALALPWLWYWRPGARSADLDDALRHLAFEGAIELGLIAGTVRHRSVVL